MPKFENIGDWVQKKYGGQVKAAKAMGTTQGVISSWINGQSIPSPEKQDLMRGKGEYDGPMPEKKGKGAAGGPYVTETAFAEWRGYWRRGEEKLLERLDALEKRVQALEDQARKAGLPAV